MNSFAAFLAIIFFPGIIASIICEQITIHSERWGYFKYTLYSFIFGIFSYIIEQLIYFFYPSFSIFVSYFSKIFNTKMSMPIVLYAIKYYKIQPEIIMNVVIAVVFSPLVAFVFSYLYNKKIINRIASKFGISKKYGDETLYYRFASLFSDEANSNYVVINDKEKSLTYQGLLSIVSVNSSIQEIILDNVSVYDYDSSNFLYSSPRIYISKPPGGFTIEYPANSGCKDGERNEGEYESNSTNYNADTDEKSVGSDVQ